MYQKLIAIGRLGADVESKATVSGSQVSKFPLAVNEGFGENKKTEWLQVVCFDKLADLCVQYLRKGSMCMIEGRVVTRSWEDKQGVKKYTTEVIAHKAVFLDSNKDAETEEPF